MGDPEPDDVVRAPAVDALPVEPDLTPR